MRHVTFASGQLLWSMFIVITKLTNVRYHLWFLVTRKAGNRRGAASYCGWVASWPSQLNCTERLKGQTDGSAHLARTRRAPEPACSLIGALWLVVFGTLVGCGQHEHPRQQGGQSGTRSGGTGEVEAQSILERTIAAYQALRSYQDNGQVVLRYRLDGKWEEDRAPMRVAMDRDARMLGLAVYSVEAGPHNGRFYLRCSDNDERFTGQIISRALPRELTLAWLNEDPWVAEQLGAGLAGYPVQLHLLLAQQPLTALLDDAALELLVPGRIGDHTYHRVAVTREDGVYELWIDKNSGLIRRVLYPSTRLPAEMLKDHRVTDIQLSVELLGAVTDKPIDWAQFHVEPRAGEMRLVRFVPRPPNASDPWLGQIPPAFQLAGADEQIVFESHRAHGKRGVILMWLADHSASREAARYFGHLAETMKQLGLNDAFELVTIWAQPEPPAGSTFETLTQDWQTPPTLAVDRDAVGRDLFGITTAPSLVVMDKRGCIQLRLAQWSHIRAYPIKEFLTALKEGRDLVAEQRQTMKKLRRRFAAEVRLAAAHDAMLGSTSLDDYDPILIGLELEQAWRLETRIANATFDSQGRLWGVTSHGELRRWNIDQDGLRLQSWPAEWKVTQQDALTVSPSCRYIARVSQPDEVIEILDMQRPRMASAAARFAAPAVDMCWWKPETPSDANEQLVVALRDGSVLVCAPDGKCQSRLLRGGKPAALVRNSVGQPDAISVVLSSGRLELLSGTGIMQVGEQVLSPGPSSRPLATRLVAAGEGPPEPGSSSSRRAPPSEHTSALGFVPAAGPWAQINIGGTWTLARGWLHPEEPALFLLNDQLQTVWHYRVAPQSEDRRCVASEAVVDPTAGLAYCVYVDSSQFIYLLRTDGVCDHFRRSEAGPVLSADLVVMDGQLVLRLVYPNQLVSYRLRFP